MSPTLRHLVIITTLWAAALGVQAQDTQQVFGSWTLRCSGPGADAGADCMMFQNLVQKAGGQPVLQFGIGMAPPDGLPTVLVSLPLGIALPPGITVQIDSGAAAIFPIERCEPDGCRASFKMRDATVQQLSQGQQLRLTFYDGERKPLKVSLSLEGFGAAFKALAAAQH
ncbi:MAG: invasion associated locus B family protein [Gammaproteobacteria bacterium]|nr:invasion associated locus B family protein [Gammaproteobacteria bacterium]